MAIKNKNNNNKAIKYLTELINEIVQGKIQVTNTTRTEHSNSIVDLPTGNIELDFIVLPKN